MAVIVIWFIMIQIKWIKGAMEIREKQFVQLVNKSLLEVVHKLEQREVVLQISNQATSFSYDSILHNKNIKNQIITDFVSSRATSSNLLILSQDKSNFETNNFNKNHNRITDKTIFVENIVNNLIRKKIDIENRLNPVLINSLLSETFDQHSIELKYEFAIFVENTEVFYNTDSFFVHKSDEIFYVALFPNDIVTRQNCHLELYFPYEKDIIFFTLPEVALSTLFVTIAMIFIFVITIYIILRQKKLSDMKTDFVNNMTHELKTPISTISLASQMLKDKSIPAEKKDFNIISKIIDDETKRIGFQVEKILQMAIIERGHMKFQKQNIDIHNLLLNVINSFSLKINNLEGEIIQIFNATNYNISADKVHITNVFYNLIDNAIKYTKQNPIIEIQTANYKSKLIISIKDNGIGISKENQKRIFNKFFRVLTGNVHDVKGFGLGLSYVKRIIDEHQGKIKINSKLDKGTTFYLYLSTIES